MKPPNYPKVAETDIKPDFIAPCTAIQERFLELQARDPDSSIGNVSMRWRMVGAVREKSVEAALSLLADRHESLRTRFERGEGGSRQIVERCQIKLSLIDLSQLPEDLYKTEVDRIARLEAQTAFNPATAPLWRAALLRQSPRETILLVTFHATVADGWSVGVFAREFTATLDCLERGSAPELPELELQYGDYARWQEALLGSDAVNDERRYWRQRMAYAVPLDVAATRKPPVRGQRDGEIRSVMLPQQLIDRLNLIGRQRGYTMFALGATCLATALSRAWRAKELIIGTQVGGRDDPLMLGVIGPTANTVILRLDATLAPDFWGFASHVRTVTADALANKALPFDEIVADTKLSSQPDLPFGYEVNFTLQSANIDTDLVGSIRSGQIELVSIPSVSAGCLYDLNFFMVGREEGWRISCEFNTDRHEAGAVDALIEAWRLELAALVNPPASHINMPEVRIEDALAEPVATTRPLLRQPSRNYFQPLELYSEGRLPPVFAISQHSLYYPIARRVADDRPFIDLQWPADALLQPLIPDAIEDIAADAARLIRAFDPVGPYYLISFCVLGNVALETARQLHAAGSKPPTLFLLDTLAAGYVEGMSRKDRWLRYLQNTDLSENLLQALHLKTPTIDPEQDHSNQIMNYLVRARKQYRPAPYPGDVVFFRSSDAKVGRLYSRSFGWNQIVEGDLRVYDVPGQHLSILHEESAAIIAEHMLWTMDKAEQRWRVPPAKP
ncbi:MAG: condensation protein [Xanthobacteraceae bacterium]|nr:condensation protein [Xanthobacteraceae bacterium]